MTEEEKVQPDRKSPSELTEEEFIADPYNKAAIALNRILRNANTDLPTRSMILKDFQYIYDTLSEEEMRLYHQSIMLAVTGAQTGEKVAPAVKIWTPGGKGLVQ